MILQVGKMKKAKQSAKYLKLIYYKGQEVSSSSSNLCYTHDEPANFRLQRTGTAFTHIGKEEKV